MFDFPSIAKKYNIPTRESGSKQCHEGWVQLHCPFCGDGPDGWHLGFCLEKGNFNCWHCGSHKTWDVLLAFLKDKKLVHHILQDSEYFNNHAPTKTPKARPKTLWEPPGIFPLASQHKKYLAKRKFDPDQIESLWELQGTKHLSGSWNWRVVFPIKDKTKNVAWCGRSIQSETNPKYKMSDNKDILISPKSLLYGIHLVENFCVVVEGPTDVWRLGPGAVGLLGMDWTKEQLHQLIKIPRRFIMLDPEENAQKRAYMLAESLSLFPGVTEVVSDLSCDPGDLPQFEAESIMKELKTQ